MSNAAPLAIFHFRLTRSQVEEKRTMAILDGFNITGDSGEAVYYGARLKYMYSDKTQILSLALMERTGLAKFQTLAMIQKRAEDWFGVKNDA